MNISENKNHCQVCGSSFVLENDPSYCKPCLNRKISDLCKRIMGFLNNLEQILDISKGEFLGDEMRQQAAGFQLMKWAKWCSVAPFRFWVNFPMIDMSSTWLMLDTPDWKQIYEIRYNIDKMKQIARAGIT